MRRTARVLIGMVYPRDNYLRLVVHFCETDRHVDCDLTLQAEALEVSSDQIAKRHFSVPIMNHHYAANHKSRVFAVSLDRYLRSLIYSLNHLACYTH